MIAQFNPIAFVVPAFLIFLGIEFYVARKKKRPELFNYESSVSNISVGIAERMLNLLITGSFYTLYYFVFEHYALFSISNAWWVWVLLLFVTDFVWYWYHRLGHEVNFFWGAHIVHHQSEEFNFTVSARITTWQAVLRNLFWIILPFIGFHPAMVLTILLLHGGYPFFVHTQLIGKLGWLEFILVTPSHHGVHHASNEKYLDKNYGNIFIIWDMLFGTFQVEEEKPVYGLTHPLKSKSFLWQHFHFYAELIEACRRTSGLKNWLRIIFGRPDKMDASVRPYLEDRLLAERISFDTTFRFKAYLNIQLVICFFLVFGFTFFYNLLDGADKLFVVAFTLVTLINCGALLEQRKWVFNLEAGRLLMVLGYVSYVEAGLVFFLISVFAVMLIASLDSMRQLYFRFLFQGGDIAL